jgi:hypothetical protein
MTVGEVTDLIVDAVKKATTDIEAIAAYALSVTAENVMLQKEIDFLKAELEGKYEI